MPIELPNLDDIDYDDLVTGAIAALPAYGSDWTNYNPSDPGITVLEMLAWLTEMLVYRTNQIQPTTYVAFLQLLKGYDESALRDKQAIRAAVASSATSRVRFEREPLQTMHDVLLMLRRRYRAVTADDYQQLALNTFPEFHPNAEKLARVACLAESNVTDPDPDASVNAVSLVVLPAAPPDANPWIQPSDDLVQLLAEFFEDRRMVTTHVYVAGPRFVKLRVNATVYIDPDAHPPRVLAQAKRLLCDYLHPVCGGPDHNGWPFGRPVYGADLTAQLANVDGISFVDQLRMTTVSSGGSEGRPPTPQGAARDMAAATWRALHGDVALEDDQLPQLSSDMITLETQVLSGALGQQGSQWSPWNPGGKGA